MKFITDEDIEYMKRTLKNYYYLKKEEQYALKEAMRLQLIYDEEKMGSGISYESSGNGCSVSFPKCSYLDSLVKEIATYDLEAKRIAKKYTTLDNHNHILKRIKGLSNDQQVIIYAVFNKNTSYKAIADDLEIKETTISDRLKKAIVAMLEVEV